MATIINAVHSHPSLLKVAAATTIFLLSISLPIQSCFASDSLTNIELNVKELADHWNIEKYSYSKHSRVIGWRISKNMYFGRTKFAKKSDMGFFIDRGDHAICIGTKGISFNKVF